MESCECAPKDEPGCAVGQRVPLPVWIQDWVSRPHVTSSDDDKMTRSS